MSFQTFDKVMVDLDQITKAPYLLVTANFDKTLTGWDIRSGWFYFARSLKTTS
jgi:hypothetical protein